jgi:hypothetical protein
MERRSYPNDVSGAEWALVAPYLTLMTEDAPQREHPLREVFNGLRWIVRAGSSWRRIVLANDAARSAALGSYLIKCSGIGLDPEKTRLR